MFIREHIYVFFRVPPSNPVLKRSTFICFNYRQSPELPVS